MTGTPSRRARAASSPPLVAASRTEPRSPAAPDAPRHGPLRVARVAGAEDGVPGAGPRRHVVVAGQRERALEGGPQDGAGERAADPGGAHARHDEPVRVLDGWKRRRLDAPESIPDVGAEVEDVRHLAAG